MKQTSVTIGLLAIVGLFAQSAVSAQTASTGTYPNRPVRIVGPSSPGGGIDASGRILAAALSQSLGQQVVFENRPGAGGIIGTELVAKAPPDGHTLILTAAAGMVVFPHTFSKLSYDPLRDFAPITLVAASDYILAVHPSLPVKTVKDLIALAKARPGQIVFSSSGNFGLPHLAGELLKQQAQIQMLHVPYKGGGPAAMAILGGEVSLMFGTGPTVVPHAQNGRLRLIATASAKRSKSLPDLPTVAELGFPGFETTFWMAVLAPAGTPKNVVQTLEKAFVRTLQDPQIVERLTADGVRIIAKPGSYVDELVARELKQWPPIVKKAGIAIN